MHRFYLPGPYAQATVELPEEEASHLSKVLRIRPGEEVVVFDGRGTAAVAVVETTGKRGTQLGLRQILPLARPRRPHLTLAVAPPKADRFRWLVEKATEIGVDRLIPLQTQRSVVTPGQGKLLKAQQTVIAACKQSGRNDLMEIETPYTWDDLITRDFGTAMRFLTHSQGLNLEVFRQGLQEALRVLVIVGPEGGLTDDERAQAHQAGFHFASLGPTWLRIETAAITAASYVRLTCSAESL